MIFQANLEEMVWISLGNAMGIEGELHQLYVFSL